MSTVSLQPVDYEMQSDSITFASSRINKLSTCWKVPTNVYSLCLIRFSLFSGLPSTLPRWFVLWSRRLVYQNNTFYHLLKNYFNLGLPYCETHYHAKRGSLCAGCSKPITGRCITAMFKKFHPEHFVCAFCLKQLNKGTFKEQNDKPYCHGCFDKLFG